MLVLLFGAILLKFEFKTGGKFCGYSTFQLKLIDLLRGEKNFRAICSKLFLYLFKYISPVFLSLPFALSTVMVAKSILCLQIRVSIFSRVIYISVAGSWLYNNKRCVA